jgi:hypothetical protein
MALGKNTITGPTSVGFRNQVPLFIVPNGFFIYISAPGNFPNFKGGYADILFFIVRLHSWVHLFHILRLHIQGLLKKKNRKQVPVQS